MPAKDVAVRRATARAFYARNREPEMERVRQRKIACRVWLHEQKRGPCIDCGQSYHPVVMDFDHVGDDKTRAVSTMAHRGVSITRMAQEIEKCELVCSNCHRIRTYERWLARRDSNTHQAP